MSTLLYKDTFTFTQNTLELLKENPNPTRISRRKSIGLLNRAKSAQLTLAKKKTSHDLISTYLEVLMLKCYAYDMGDSTLKQHRLPVCYLRGFGYRTKRGVRLLSIDKTGNKESLSDGFFAFRRGDIAYDPLTERLFSFLENDFSFYRGYVNGRRNVEHKARRRAALPLFWATLTVRANSFYSNEPVETLDKMVKALQKVPYLFVDYSYKENTSKNLFFSDKEPVRAFRFVTGETAWVAVESPKVAYIFSDNPLTEEQRKTALTGTQLSLRARYNNLYGL